MTCYFTFLVISLYWFSDEIKEALIISEDSSRHILHFIISFSSNKNIRTPTLNIKV